jgi:hypothetical protein
VFQVLNRGNGRQTRFFGSADCEGFARVVKEGLLIVPARILGRRLSRFTQTTRGNVPVPVSVQGREGRVVDRPGADTRKASFPLYPNNPRKCTCPGFCRFL